MNSSSSSLLIDGINMSYWNETMRQFYDASIYQSWSYGTAFGMKSSHIIIRKGDSPNACCQLALRNIPAINSGIASVKWGPLFLKKGTCSNYSQLSDIICAIKNEYGIGRGCLIKIEPNVMGETKPILKTILEKEGFKRNFKKRPYRTFILDLAHPLVDLRANFLKKWRNSLNKAEKCGLRIIEGTGDDLYSIFQGLAKEMIVRKNLRRGLKNYHYRFGLIQRELPVYFKMRIFVAFKGSLPVSAAVVSSIGNTGIYLFGATGQAGLQYNGSYLLQWNILRHLKEEGLQYYDLGAFNPQINPGVYQFKAGIAGKVGRDEIFLGEYIGTFGIKSRIVNILLNYSRFIDEARESILRRIPTMSSIIK